MAQDLCKYYKKQRYASYNDGLTWQPLEEYEKGELYETHSASCGAGVFQYRWVLVDNGYICDGKDRYTREVYQYSEDGVVWYDTFPTQYRKGYLVESNSKFCDNAGNGQYTSGDTEPVTGGTSPCPPNYYWDGHDCVCSGIFVDGECIKVCDDPNSHYDLSKNKCVCNEGYNYQPCSVCARNIQECYNLGGVDPLKIVKCSEANGVINRSNTQYYTKGWVLTAYTIGDCVQRIDDDTFNGQVDLLEITIPSSVVEVGSKAFANCKKLTSINFPSDYITFEKDAFWGCDNLQYITFGETPNVIPNGIFRNCISLESVEWLSNDSNITIIGEYSFAFCYSLNNVTLPDTLQTIGINAFYGNRSLTNITIPSGVTSIGVSAFENCTAMTFANINSNEVSIGDAAFRGNTSLTAATINSSEPTIGSNVFSGCTRLLKLTFTAAVPPQISQVALDNSNECAIFVPCDSEEAYKTAWSQYADRISCNDPGIYYRWVDDQNTYCEGTDEYARQKQQQTTNGVTWTDTGAYRIKELITHYSKKCGYVGDVALTVTNEDGYTRYYEPCQ